jgi:hypothetical protein
MVIGVYYFLPLIKVIIFFTFAQRYIFLPSLKGTFFYLRYHRRYIFLPSIKGTYVEHDQYLFQPVPKIIDPPSFCLR